MRTSKTALVGHTGFVGSNLKASFDFANLYNSKNIRDAYGTEPDLLVYAGLPSAMFKANKAPEEDFADVLRAIENIKYIKPKQVVLISTVAVYDKTYNVDETYVIDERMLLPYGKNRLYMERWVAENCDENLILRLPALYGINLRKNFIFDFINVIPMMLNEERYHELEEKSQLIRNAYEVASDNYYHLVVSNDEKIKLYEFFKSNDFNAISFTDSRSIYQFYNLTRLWQDINIALKNNIRLLNLVTEPVSVTEVYKVLSGGTFKNELNKQLFNYDIRSIYSDLFGGQSGYLIDKDSELKDLKQYVDKEKRRIWG